MNSGPPKTDHRGVEAANRDSIQTATRASLLLDCQVSTRLADTHLRLV